MLIHDSLGIDYRVSQKKLKDFDERLHHDVITKKLLTFFHHGAEGLT